MKDCMKYTLEKISTVEACETLLATAFRKKQILERKRRNLGESISNFMKRLDHIGQETTLVQALLVMYTTAYNVLPPGSKYRLDINIKIKRLEVRQARLDLRAYSCNERTLLAKQVKYNALDSQVAVMNTYINALKSKRAALLNAEWLADKGTASWYQRPVNPISQAVKMASRRQVYLPARKPHVGKSGGSISKIPWIG